MQKSKLKLVQNRKQPKKIFYNPIRRKIIRAFNRALKEAQDGNWQEVIIVGSAKEENFIVHSRSMKDDAIISSLERAKHFILTTDRIEQ